MLHVLCQHCVKRWQQERKYIYLLNKEPCGKTYQEVVRAVLSGVGAGVGAAEV